MRITKRKLTHKEAKSKYSKDQNVNEKFRWWLQKGIKRYNTTIQVVRSGRITTQRKEMDMDLKLNYAKICGKVVGETRVKN